MLPMVKSGTSGRQSKPFIQLSALILSVLLPQGTDYQLLTKLRSLRQIHYTSIAFTRKEIVGLKEEESCRLLPVPCKWLKANGLVYLLNFLFDHIERGQDWHLRVHWTPGTVIVYDNRVTQQQVKLPMAGD